MRGRYAVLFLVVAVLLTPSDAFAVVTVGSDLSGETGSADCGGSTCTIAQTALPGRDVTAPFDGVIVHWRVRAATGSVRLRVLHPAGAGAFTNAAQSQPVQATSTESLTFNSRTPVKAGDSIGVDLIDPSSSLGYRSTPGATDATWEPEFNPMAVETRSPSGSGADEDLYNADIEPDADGDGYGDETQDLCPTDKATHFACADIALATSVTPTPVFFGDAITYTLTITNNGPADAQAVGFSFFGSPDPHAPEVFVSATPSAGTCSAPTLDTQKHLRPGHCDIGDIALGRSATVTLVVRYFEARAFHDTLTVGSSPHDPNAANNAGTFDFTVAMRTTACSNARDGTELADRTLAGTSFGDLLHGFAGNDVISGLDGADCIFGGAGADKLKGGTGNDKLYGEAGNDYLIGDAGNDLLIGGPGTNRYNAGPGNDIINSRNHVSEIVVCGPGKDRVKADKSDRLSGCEKKSVR